MSEHNAPATDGPRPQSSPRPPLYPSEMGPEGDATFGVIPYKNPMALGAYYLGIFGLVPIIGLPVALLAIVMGIVGLRRRTRTPIIRGAVHAWIGIVLGSASVLGHSVVLVLIVIAMMSAG